MLVSTDQSRYVVHGDYGHCSSSRSSFADNATLIQGFIFLFLIVILVTTISTYMLQSKHESASDTPRGCGCGGGCGGCSTIKQCF